MTNLVLKAAGPLSTIQDAGRFGYQRYGVSTAGAADMLLHAVANSLVGNVPTEGAIEFTLSGDTLVAEGGPCRVAVAGDVPVFIDGVAKLPWMSHRVEEGQTVRVGMLRSGLRGYLAVAGGFALSPMLGSVSTHIRNRLGGLDGEKLGPGARLPLRADSVHAGAELMLDPAELPERRPVLRVVLGPQDDYFTPAGLDTFLTSPYEITPEADRMGYRMQGEVIEHSRGFNITSDGIPLGAIQVPGTGQPIIMLVDRQTTGGYPKIACVIAPDIGILAQLRPGEKLRFQAVDRAEAHRLHLNFRTLIDTLPDRLREISSARLRDSEWLLSHNLVGGVINCKSTDWELL